MTAFIYFNTSLPSATLTLASATVALPLLAAGHTNRLYDTLWQARSQGVARLEKTLRTSVNKGLPTTKKQLIKYLEVAPERSLTMHGLDTAVIPFYQKLGLTKNFYLTAIHKRQFYLQSLKKNLKWRIIPKHVVALIVSLIYVKGIIGKQTWAYMMMVLFVGVTYDFLYLRVAPNKLSQSQASVLQTLTDQKETNVNELALRMQLSGVAAYLGDRPLEQHFLALLSENLYKEARKKPQEVDEIANSLVLLAQCRGSHHAAHYLWMLRQSATWQLHFRSKAETSDDRHDFNLWPYDPDLVQKALSGDAIAEDVVNLMVRESVDFRRRYIEHLEAKEIDPDDDVALTVAKRLSAPHP